MGPKTFCNQRITIPSYAYAFWDGYAIYNGLTTIYKPYGKPCAKDDILSMTLNLTETEDKKLGTLSFTLNNKLFEKKNAYDDIDTNKKYCMALAVFNDDNFQLIE